MNSDLRPPSEEPSGSLPAWAAFTAMGLTLAACVSIGVVLGIVADSALGTSSILLFVGLLLGCAAAAGAVVSLVRRYL